MITGAGLYFLLFKVFASGMSSGELMPWGPRSRFHSRSLMTLVAGQVQKVGWNGCTGLDSQCHAELDFWNDNLRSLNGGAH